MFGVGEQDAEPHCTDAAHPPVLSSELEHNARMAASCLRGLAVLFAPRRPPRGLERDVC